MSVIHADMKLLDFQKSVVTLEGFLMGSTSLGECPRHSEVVQPKHGITASEEAPPASRGVSSVERLSKHESASQVVVLPPFLEGTLSAQGVSESKLEGYASPRDPTTEGDGRGEAYGSPYQQAMSADDEAGMTHHWRNEEKEADCQYFPYSVYE
ncbi:hypothetical protein Pcinc_026238 [Petrolisthes cinctipes]|uniref:Uncharacterized protein n=1 Tax=Petrolisthes cinctipes TaxID=88211 RepID=A0AAE1F7V8_PETCI|nr:hypothetical protein Pcinc_026238 [Petrolisthes cinctipes]